MMRKEFIQVFRDPKMRAVIFLMPLIQTMVFGYAVTTDVTQVPTAVYDQSQTPASRSLLDKFIRSEYFTVKAELGTEQEIDEVLNYGKVAIVIHIPPDYGQKLAAGEKAAVQIIVDGTDANTAGLVLNYSNRIINNSAIEILQRQTGNAAETFGGVKLATRVWFNENLTSRNFYVPGVIAIIVMLVTLLLTSMAVVREKELGTMEQIIVTPISSWEFILGKTMPSIMIGFTNVAFIAFIGVFWFNIPVRGSLILLFFATALFLMTTIGIGLFISTVSSTQQQAMMSTFFFYFPAILLSGFMFPIANMPEPVQYFTYLNPLRYFLIIIRGIFLKGVGITVLWPQLVALLFLGNLVLLSAVSNFRKKLA